MGYWEGIGYVRGVSPGYPTPGRIALYHLIQNRLCGAYVTLNHSISIGMIRYGEPMINVEELREGSNDGVRLGRIACVREIG